ncbi:MAG: alpha/beta fold hydrolase, partial [Chitinivibrionales bacterium]|nr:alpha/beta fold hydrolase [Chitinivibrionales bacterium]
MRFGFAVGCMGLARASSWSGRVKRETSNTVPSGFGRVRLCRNVASTWRSMMKPTAFFPRRSGAFLRACVYLALGCMAGCLELDPFLFGGEELTQYSLDSYTGVRECSDYIDLAGPVEPSLVHAVSFGSGGETLHGVLLHRNSVCTSSDTLILYFHGKSYHIDYYWPRVRMLYDAAEGRYPIFAIDYRGYGMSSGEATEDGLYQDGASALAYVRKELGDPSVILYAYSLGSLIGCKTAADDASGRVVALALEAPIGAISTIVSDATYLNIPGSAVTTYTGDNTERIKRVDLPLLWLHGTDDETLAIETNGQPVWDSYAGPDGAAVIVGGGGHANLPQSMSSDYSRYKTTVG